MIDIRNLSFSYKNDQVLNDLSGIFSKGKVTSILGRNGSGKSTLMKQINGILKPSEGIVYIDGNNLSDMSAKKIAKDVGFLSQRTEGIDATVIDAVLTGRRPHINFSITSTDTDIAKKTLRLMGLHDMACRKTTEISGGELQKVVIARALVQEPKILLLDEPVNHLDMVNQLEVLGLIRDVTLDKELTSVIVMHDINTAIRFSDDLVFIKDGEVLGRCGVDNIDTELISSAFGIEVEMIHNNDRIFIVPK